jgi:hypothetical protein
MRYVTVGILCLVCIVALLAPIIVDARRWFPRKKREKPREYH